MTGEGVEDADINAACGVLANQVESGRSLAQSMAERALFPVGLPRLLRWAETQKSLPEVLHMAGSMLEARARSQSTFVGIVLNFLCVLMISRHGARRSRSDRAAHHPDFPLVRVIATSFGERLGHGKSESTRERGDRLGSRRARRPEPARSVDFDFAIDPARLARLSNPQPLAAPPPHVPGRPRGGLALGGRSWWRGSFLLLAILALACLLLLFVSAMGMGVILGMARGNQAGYTLADPGDRGRGRDAARPGRRGLRRPVRRNLCTGE